MAENKELAAKRIRRVKEFFKDKWIVGRNVILIGVPLTLFLGGYFHTPHAAVEISAPQPKRVQAVAVSQQASASQRIASLVSALNEGARLGTVYYRDGESVKQFRLDLIRFNSDPDFPKSVLERLLTPQQRLTLSGILQRSVEERSQQVLNLDRMLYASPEERERIRSEETPREPVDPNFYQYAFLRDDLSSILKPEDVRAINDLLLSVPKEKKEALAKQFENEPGEIKAGGRALGTALASLMLLTGIGAAAGDMLQKSVSKKSLEKTARKVDSQGKIVTPAAILAQHGGLGKFYSWVIAHHPSLKGNEKIQHALVLVAQDHAEEAWARLSALKRAPANFPEDLKRHLFASYLLKEPPSFYLMYGGHKETEEGVADSKDAEFFKLLGSISSILVETGFKKPVIEAIFTDKHALINGAEKKRVEKYRRSLAPLARQYGVNLVDLSALEKSRDWKFRARKITGLDSRVDRVLQDPKVRRDLEKGASRHSNLDTKEAVRNYAAQRVAEGEILSSMRHSEFHLAPGNPRVSKALMTGVPTFFLNTGERELPWFSQGEPLVAKEKSRGLRVAPWSKTLRPAPVRAEREY